MTPVRPLDTIRAVSTAITFVPRAAPAVLSLALAVPALVPTPADAQHPRPGENVRIAHRDG